jgi:hypothetical protein
LAANCNKLFKFLVAEMFMVGKSNTLTRLGRGVYGVESFAGYIQVI